MLFQSTVLDPILSTNSCHSGGSGREREGGRDAERTYGSRKFRASFHRVVHSCKFTVFVLTVIKTKSMAWPMLSTLGEQLGRILVLTACPYGEGDKEPI